MIIKKPKIEIRSSFSERKNQPLKTEKIGAKEEKIVTLATSIFE